MLNWRQMTLSSPLPSCGRSFFWIVGLALVLGWSQCYTAIVRAEEVELPPLIDSDDISYFFGNGYDINGLHWALTSIFGNLVRNGDGTVELPDQLVSRGGGDFYTTKYKLQCDLEQAHYLVQQHPPILSPKLQSYFETVVIPGYQAMIRRIPELDQLQKTHGLYPFTAEDYRAVPTFSQFYNKALFVPEYDIPSTIINPKLDVQQIESEWVKSGKLLSVIDDVLSDEMLHQVRKLLLESTVWYQTKMPQRFGGYVGAYIDDGLHAKLLLLLAKELHRTFPAIFYDEQNHQSHSLKYLWAYKYDSQYGGIHTHADQAAVNVNIWLTPDEANLDKESGGLVVFTRRPPSDWDFEAYNTDKERMERDILIPSNYANVTVPFRYNRAVIFDSALFHHTDEFKFQPGYTNRRINLTLLYGNMKQNSPHNTNDHHSNEEL